MNSEYEIIKHPRLKYINPFIVELNYRKSHLHKDFECCVILDGEVSIQSSHQQYELKKQDVILFNPLQPHELIASSHNVLILSLQISPKFSQLFYPSLHLMQFTVSHLSPFLKEEEICKIRNIIIEASDFYFKKEAGYELKCMSLINELFYQFIKVIPYELKLEEDIQKGIHQLNRINRIIKYIEEHASEKPRLSEVAKQEKLSLSYISSFFKEQMNMTFQDYVNEVRFEKAKQLLINTDAKLIDICMEAGFSDQRYLNAMFQAQYGCSAKQFKEKHTELLKDRAATISFGSQQIFSEQESLHMLKKYKGTRYLIM